MGREGRRPPSAVTAEASARPRGALELDTPSELPQTEVRGGLCTPTSASHWIQDHAREGITLEEVLPSAKGIPREECRDIPSSHGDNGHDS